MSKSRAINPELVKKAGDRIRTARALAGLTRPELEKLYGIKNTTIAKWETGVAMPSLRCIHQLVKALREHSVVSSAEWFLYGKGQEAHILNYSISPNALNDNPLSSLGPSPTNLDPDILLMEELRFFKNLYTDAVITLVNDDAMSPQFAMGDYVGGLKLSQEGIDKALYKPCIVELTDGRKKLRQVIPGSQRGLYNLCGTNNRAQAQHSIMMDVKLNWVAPLTWHRLIA